MLENNADNSIILYTSGCPKCNILKKKLDDKNIKYSVFDDVDKMIEMGFNEMPVLDVNGKKMNYVEAVKWING
jgi:glutaredoxin